MRHLIQTTNMTRAGVAALATAMLCTPRLITWADRTEHIWYLWLGLLWSSFFMWSFVMGWHPVYARRSIFHVSSKPVWIMATVIAGVMGAVLLTLTVDPVLRELRPELFPRTIPAWTSRTLFTISFEQLFYSLAPLAFFLRLIKKPNVAMCATVALSVMVMSLKLTSVGMASHPGMMLQLLVIRAITQSILLFFYWRCGYWSVALILLLAESRHLATL